MMQMRGRIAEQLYPEAYKIKSSHPFKGNMNIEALDAFIEEKGKENIPYIRMEASTNLIGGLRFTYEPKVLRFFMGRLEPTSDWPVKLMTKFRADFGDSL